MSIILIAQWSKVTLSLSTFLRFYWFLIRASGSTFFHKKLRKRLRTINAENKKSKETVDNNFSKHMMS